jgi:hypothetical protein
MEWLFEGLGTAIISLVFGAAGGSLTTWKIMSSRTSQRQKAGQNSVQMQSGGNMEFKA